MANKRVVCESLLTAAMTVVLASCSAAGETDESERGAQPGGEAGGDIPPAEPDEPWDDACTGPHCSIDLHSLVDCDGKVLMECPPNQGCAGTSCVPACQSASENKSTFGCDYYAVTPDVVMDGAGACFAAFIVNTWSSPVTLSVDFGGQPLDVSKFAYIPRGTGASTQYQRLAGGVLPAGEIAILFLNRNGPWMPPLALDMNCPVGIDPAIMTGDTAVHGTGRGRAFHIGTTAPVVAYDIYPYGGGRSAVTSATLLLPTSSWDTNYVSVDAYGGSVSIPGLPLPGPVMAIVAQANGTTVTIRPSMGLDGNPGAGIPSTPAGVPATYSLARGEVLQFAQGTQLAGGVLQSNLPIGLWGGASSLGIVSCCADSAHQQIPPVRALGHTYVGVRYRNRYDGVNESVPWRLVGVVAETKLAWEPARPPGAPASLDLGQVAEFSAPGPFLVHSQDGEHPFYMAAYMTGAGSFDPNENDGRGDPEFVNMIPSTEFLSRYVFFTDPTYPETDLVVVRQRGKTGFAPVSLDCAGELGGWQPVDPAGRFEFTRFDLVRGNFEPQGKCDNGRHEMTSPIPFGVTVWGWGSAATGVQGKGFNTQYASYAYPAGAGVKPVNSVVVPPVPR